MGVRYLNYCCVSVIALVMFSIKFTWCSEGLRYSCIETEKQALLTFKQSLVDPSNRLSSWEGQDCCSWAGVGCNNITGHVIELRLSNPIPNDGYTSSHEGTWLVGSEVNPSLVELKHLEYLDLSSNSFVGRGIPSFFGNFTKLRYLYLSYLSFAGTIPDSLGNLSFLLALDLSGNSELKVNNLDWLPCLPVLQFLDMSLVDLSRASNLSIALNSVPSLSELILFGCQLDKFPLSISSISNLTSLSVLKLYWNNFQGPLPSVLRNLTNLETLNLFHNEFSGALPDWLSDLNSLKYLYLMENSFSGVIPTSLGALPALRVIDIGYNQLCGSIPPSLGSLSKLISITLRTNKLTGPIPYSLGALSNLSELHLNDNLFNGTIPESLGALSNLQILRLQNNSLTGVVSEIHFRNLSNLMLLEAGSNSLKLNVSSEWIPPFQIRRIVLGSWRLGPKFPRWLQTQKGMDWLDISNASISDTVPDWFWSIAPNFVILDISKNKLHGSIPNLQTNVTIPAQNLLFGSNCFEGPLPHFPSNIAALDLSNNFISGPLPQNISETMPSLTTLLLSSNKITGTIPISLCKMNTLRVLDMSRNQLSGDLPKHCWSDSKDIEILDLSSNNLTGSVPSSIGNLTVLSSLHLSKNRFSGEIPLALKKCTSLKVLDLGENRFSGEISSWSNGMLSLNILRLRSNKFLGKLTPQLCHLKNLHIMDLAQNSLSGTIPPCFRNFSGMKTGSVMDLSHLYAASFDETISQVIKGRELEYTKTLLYLVNLDLSSNNFVGKIPEELASLEGLTALNLSDNHLTGGIPKTIGNLKQIESLDFSTNQLSGAIPQSILDLSFISHLNLSYNKLSGQVPFGDQFRTFDPSTYIGNPELCGIPLDKECSREGLPRAIDDGLKKEDEEFEKVGFYVSVGVGIATGFWGFFGILFFNPTWRYTYFQVVEEIFKALLITLAVCPASWLKRKPKC
ncbi:hypothetical protein ACHQM5_000081 [Ranunculus cassubicifolius]